MSVSSPAIENNFILERPLKLYPLPSLPRGPFKATTNSSPVEINPQENETFYKRAGSRYATLVGLTIF